MIRYILSIRQVSCCIFRGIGSCLQVLENSGNYQGCGKAVYQRLAKAADVFFRTALAYSQPVAEHAAYVLGEVTVDVEVELPFDSEKIACSMLMRLVISISPVSQRQGTARAALMQPTPRLRALFAPNLGAGLLEFGQPVAVGGDQFVHHFHNVVDGKFGAGVGVQHGRLVDVLLFPGVSGLDGQKLCVDIGHVHRR